MTPPSDFPIKQVDDVVVLSFPESLKSITEDEVERTKTALLGLPEDLSRVVIDLGHVDFFGSSFIEVLFRLWNRLKSRGGSFALCGLCPYCREVLSVTNLDTLWTICDSEDEAIKAVREATVS